MSRKEYLIQVDDIELFASDSVEHATLVVEEDNLERLDLLGKLACSNVGIDVENLTGIGLGETGENRKGASADGSLDGTLVDLCDLSDETVLVLVEIVGGEDTGSNGTSARAELLEGGDEFEVFVEEHAPSNLERLGVWVHGRVLKETGKG